MVPLVLLTGCGGDSSPSEEGDPLGLTPESISEGDEANISTEGETSISGNCTPDENTREGRLCSLKGKLDLLVTWRLIGETSQDVMVFKEDPVFRNDRWFLGGTISIKIDDTEGGGVVACTDITDLSDRYPFWCSLYYDSGAANSYALIKSGNEISGLFAYARSYENPLYEVLYDPSADVTGTHSTNLSTSSHALMGGFVSLEDKERATRQIASRTPQTSQPIAIPDEITQRYEALEEFMRSLRE